MIDFLVNLLQSKKSVIFQLIWFEGGRTMIKQRWIGLLCAIGLFCLAYWKVELKEAGIAFTVGAFAGIFVDFIGIKVVRYWTYTRHPFPSVNYFAIVIPCWGIFGALVNLLWNRMGGLQSWLIFLILTTALLIFWEMLNLLTRTWKYNTPIWLVMIGWFPLVFLIRVAYSILI